MARTFPRKSAEAMADMKASIPFAGSMSAMDVLRDVFSEVGDALAGIIDA